MRTSINNKKTLITGASSEIGRSMALLFAKKGSDLCLVGRNSKKLANVGKQCRTFERRILEIAADITDESQVEEMVHKSVSYFKKK